MRMNEPNQNDFDNLLKTGLQKHTVNVPGDFAQKLLGRIQQEEYTAALAAVKRTERLLVAAMILVPAAAAILILLLGPTISAQLRTVLGEFEQLLSPFMADSALHLKFWVEIAVAAGAILFYILFDSASAEN
jgi:hypothetical protein